jgi:hypothetical protein
VCFLGAAGAVHVLLWHAVDVLPIIHLGLMQTAAAGVSIQHPYVKLFTSAKPGPPTSVLLVRSQRPKLFARCCDECWMHRCGACNLSGGAPQPLAHWDKKVPGLCCFSSVVLDAPQQRVCLGLGRRPHVGWVRPAGKCSAAALQRLATGAADYLKL